MFEFGVVACLGNASWVVSPRRLIDRLYGGRELFFVSVNQVLLRLWTRAADTGPWGFSWVGQGPAVRPDV